MFELTDYIEYLLTGHDCVVVPGLGGFVNQYGPASFMADRNEIHPPYRQVIFNAALGHNDGLLVNTVMQKEQFSCDQASAWIAEKVSGLKSQLNQTPEMIYAFGELGHISMNRDGQIVFVCNKTTALYPEHFGLSPLNILPLKAYQQQTDAAASDMAGDEPVKNRIHIHWQTIRRIAVVAVLVLVMMTVSTPIRYSSDSRTVDYASVVSAEWLTFREAEEEMDPEILPDFVLNEEEGLMTEADKEEIDNPLLSSENDDGEYPSYIIVIATFSSGAAAERQCLHLKNSGIKEDIGIYEKNGKYRLYINAFDNKEDAQKCLNMVKWNTRFSDAWIMQR